MIAMQKSELKWSKLKNQFGLTASFSSVFKYFQAVKFFQVFSNFSSCLKLSQHVSSHPKSDQVDLEIMIETDDIF